jgi:hypothetical protein
MLKKHDRPFYVMNHHILMKNVAKKNKIWLKKLMKNFCNIPWKSKIRSIIPQYNQFTNKANFHKNLESFNFIPKTTIVLNGSSDADFKIFRNSKLFYLKPSDKSMGQGIHISSQINELLKISRKNCNQEYVLQENVQKTRLNEKKQKFDIRIWAVFYWSKNAELHLAIYPEAILRICKKKFIENSTDIKIMLTNHSFQKRFAKNSELIDLGSSLPDWDHIKIKIKRILSKCGSVFRKKLRPDLSKRKGCNNYQPGYWLVGLDFIPDTLGNLWFIEINNNPGCGYNKSQTNLYTKSMRDLLEELIIPMIDDKTKFHFEKWEQIF